MPDIPHMSVMTPVMKPSTTNCALACSTEATEAAAAAAARTGLIGLVSWRGVERVGDAYGNQGWPLPDP